MTDPGAQRVFRFGPFELDAAAAELRRSGIRVRLTGKSMQTLELLLERVGDVVTRDDLRDRLWSADTFVDFEDGLNHVIRRVREALEHDPKDPKFIETVPGIGYRFVGPVGTASLLSPEQARGQPLDERTVIGLPASAEGAVDREALSKTRPTAVPPLVRQFPDQDRNRRLHNIADARIELDALSEPPDASRAQSVVEDSPAPTRPTRPYAWMALSAALAITAAAALLYKTGEGPLATPVTRTMLPLPKPLPGRSRNLRVAISPNGRLIAYTAGHLYLRRLDQLEPRLVEDTAPATEPFFSPDGRWVGFVSRGLKKVPTTGGAPVSVGGEWDGRHAANGGASWSPSGTIVLASRWSVGGLMQLRAENAVPEVLTVPDLEKGHYVHRWPSVLPGEDAVILTVGRSDMESWGDASIAVLRLATGELRIVLEGGSRARYSPTGHLIYVRGSALLAVPFDLTDLRVTGRPVSVVGGVYGEAGFGLSDDGTLVYAYGGVAREKRRMVLVDRQGTTLRVLAEGGEYHHPRFSPEGGRVAFGTGGATPDIRVLDLARGAETAVTSRWLNAWPRWTTDGRHVDFQSMRSGQWNSHRRLADGSGDVERLLATEHTSVQMAAVNGVVLTYERLSAEGAGTGWDLMLRSPEAGSAARSFLATPADEWYVELSPDGEWVAYESNESGRSEIYLRRFPEGEGQWLVSTGGGHSARWNRNGREIFYLDGEYLDGDKVMAVDIRTDGESPRLGKPRLVFERPRLGKPRLVFERPISDVWSLGQNYDVAPDGQSFVIVERGEPTPEPDHLVLVQSFDDELRRLLAEAAGS